MKNKYYYLLMLLLISPLGYSNELSTGKAFLKGKVIDKKTKEGIPGASIYISDLKVGTISKADGSYRIDNLPTTKIIVQVSFIGYRMMLEKIDLSTTTNKNFELEEHVAELNEVVVTGASKATEFKKNSIPMVLINQQYISQNSSTNAIEILNKIPGLSTLSTGPNISKPYIHGLGFNRVLVLFDGVRQEGQQWGEEHGVEVDQFMVDHIEVVKGPASLMYGSDALAGVINLLPAPSVPIGTVKGFVESNYQTNNKQSANSVAINGNNNGFIWGGRFSHKLATNYKNKFDGRVYGTKYNETDCNLYAGINKSWGYSHFNFSLYNNTQEVPDGNRDSTTRKFTKELSEENATPVIVSTKELNSYSISSLHQHIQHYKFYTTNHFFIGASRLAINLGVQQSIRQEFSHPEYLAIPGLYLNLNTATYDIRLHLPQLKETDISIGINGMYQYNNSDKGSEFIIPTYHDFDVGAFLYAHRAIGKFDISTGARYDMRIFSNDLMYIKPNRETGFDMQTPFIPGDSTLKKQFDSYKHIFSGISASFGAAYNLNEYFTIKANVARGYRAPNAAEISSKGIHPGTGFLQLGDTDFKPEFSLQEDLGIFFSSTHISGSLEVFNNHLSNYIYNEKLQSVSGKDSLDNTYPIFKFRQTQALLTGGEFSIDIHPHPLDWLHFENSVSYIYAINKGGAGITITDSTKYLPLIPPLHTTSELKATSKKKIGPFADCYIKIEVQYYTPQNHYFSAYGTETYTPGYTLLKAGIGGNITNKKGNTICRINILGDNLTNLAYQSNMSRLKYLDNYPVNGTGRTGIYNIGRNIVFKLLFPIDIKKAKED